MVATVTAIAVAGIAIDRIVVAIRKASTIGIAGT